MFTRTTLHILFLFSIFMGISSCGTYNDKTKSTERALVTHKYEQAETSIKKNKFLNRKRNRLLYYLELGKVQNLRGEFKESNKSLNIADYMMESHRNILSMAVGVTLNPAMQPYQAEGHERILVHYYKALNYFQLGNIEEAIVEARRIDLTEAKNMEEANGKFKKYGTDPFGLILMGMIYEADHDYNNAFIAYDNARIIYEKDETGLYRHNIPYSLEQDLARTARFAGLYFDSQMPVDRLEYGEAILFWENGLAPAKEQKDMAFTLNKKNGAFFFKSNNLIIPIDYDFEADDPDFSPSDIGLVRLATSFYVQRPYTAKSAVVEHNGTKHRLHLIEDVTSLAFQIEKDNYMKKLGKDLLRLTIKKISELSLASQNETAGLLLNIFNAASEKADTRNWQSLPSQIHYTRIPLEKGINEITVTCSNGETNSFKIEGNGQMVFRNVVTY